MPFEDKDSEKDSSEKENTETQYEKARKEGQAVSVDDKIDDFTTSQSINEDRIQKRRIWLDKFEQQVGRKPNPDEFMKGKEAEFSLDSITHSENDDVESIQPVFVDKVTFDAMNLKEDVAPTSKQAVKSKKWLIV